MKFSRAEIPDIIIIEPHVFIDQRGYFFESFKENELNEFLGYDVKFCQDNESKSSKGVLRGLHYQLPPFSQSKLVGVLQGKVLDVVVDIRKGSPTLGQHFTQELSAENQLQLFIPRGFAHGYITLTETSLFTYKVDQYYYPESEGSIAPNDPKLAIDWQLPQEEWIQSEKDTKHPFLAEAPLFDYKDNLYD